MLSTAGRIESDAIYDDTLLYRELRITSAVLARARKSGELRYTRRGNRTLYLGQWIRNWLQLDNPAQEEGDATRG
jgi:hypothetical protein